MAIDWQMKARLKHPSFNLEKDCKWFNSQAHLPDIKNIGDVVLIRQAKVTVREAPILICYSENTRTIVFPANFMHFVPGWGQVNFLHIISPGVNITRPSPQEQLHAEFLQQWAIDEPNLASAHSPMPKQQLNKKSELLKNVTSSHYYDIVGEVVKLYSKPGSIWTEIYVTDYTTNNLFFPYKTGDAGQPDRDGSHDPGYLTEKKQWNGPQGKVTIRVTLWPPNSEFANNNVSLGDFVQLRNMYVKYNDKYLEGACRSDAKYPDKIAIAVLKKTDISCATLISRKKAYLAQMHGPVPANETKGQKRKRLKKEKEDEKKARKQREMMKRRDGEMVVTPRRQIRNQPSDAQKSGLNANGKSKAASIRFDWVFY
jgi:protection of telomeres protein 1